MTMIIIRFHGKPCDLSVVEANEALAKRQPWLILLFNILKLQPVAGT